MAFFPDVNRGEIFRPNTLLSNNLRRMVNTLNGFQGGGQLGSAGGMVRIQVYCSSGGVEAGSAVNFCEDGEFCGDAIPCEACVDPSKPWGVVVRKLAANEIGSCIISGPVRVKISGSGGEYAQPEKSDPSVFQRGSQGAPILFASGEDAVINLGAATRENYTGPFAVTEQEGGLKVNPGHCVINLEEFDVPETILPFSESGFVVLESSYSGGTISTPQITMQSSRPKVEKEKIGIVLAGVEKEEGGNILIFQKQYGEIHAVLWGECEDEEEKEEIS